MRVFLSHSSQDRDYVQKVAAQLRPGTYELDSQTFTVGESSANAALEALARCEIFCIFLSRNSLESSFVKFEIDQAIEAKARGKIHLVLGYCLDQSGLDNAPHSLRSINLKRHLGDPSSTARHIQGAMISLEDQMRKIANPFLGREEELRDLERQVCDIDRPQTKCLFIAGNFGSGRRTLARKFFQNQFPAVGRFAPAIQIEPFAGPDELYRAVLVGLKPSLLPSELNKLITEFGSLSNQAREEATASLINALLDENQMAFVMDNGGGA